MFRSSPLALALIVALAAGCGSSPKHDDAPPPPKKQTPPPPPPAKGAEPTEPLAPPPPPSSNAPPIVDSTGEPTIAPVDPPYPNWVASASGALVGSARWSGLGDDFTSARSAAEQNAMRARPGARATTSRMYWDPAKQTLYVLMLPAR